MSKININKKKLKYGTLASVITVVVIAIVVLVNIILSVASDKVNMKIDLTEDKIFEISEDSVNYIKKLDEDVSIVCMTSEKDFKSSGSIYFKQAYEVLKKYTDNSDRIKLTFVDMVEDPTYADSIKNLYSGQITQYSIIVRCGDRIKVVGVQDLYNVEIDYNTYQQKIVSSKAEQVITSAIMYVTDPDPLHATILNVESVGAGTDNISEMLDKNGYVVSSIDPLTESIPEETDLLVMSSPLNDCPESLMLAIESFLENGGKYGKNMIYIADNEQNSTPNIDTFLSRWGIEVGKGIICETQEGMYNSQAYEIMAVIPEEVKETYAENVTNIDQSTIAGIVRPINTLFESRGNYVTVPLLQSSDGAYVLTDELIQKMQNGDNTIPATSVQNVIVASEKCPNRANLEEKSTLMVVGSSYVFSEMYTGVTYVNNGEYFVSAINYMTGKSNGISIVPKDLTDDTFEMNMTRYTVCRNIFVFIIPCLVIVAGIVVAVRRRRH